MTRVIKLKTPKINKKNLSALGDPQSLRITSGTIKTKDIK